MLVVKLAIRSLAKRKGRSALIGALVAFGTLLLVLGGIFASSSAEASRLSIIENFTGDFVLYSERSKELPSPFAFTTPLPPIRDAAALGRALDAIPEVEGYALFAQNYGLIQVERGGKRFDLPFIFYAVEPESYRALFPNAEIREGSWFGLDAAGGRAASAEDAGAGPAGILISEFQNEQYERNYGVRLEAGEPVTLLGVTEGGVGSERSVLAGIFEPRRYKNVFDYINFVDAGTYARLYSFTGVSGLPEDFDLGLESAGDDEESLFALAADEDFGRIDVGGLRTEALSGYTVAAVKLRDHDAAAAVAASLVSRPELGVKAATWSEASGFYARISQALQAAVFAATGLIFLVVVLIFMNSLVISVVERTAEIGTMRAIGADRSFVRRLFLAETLVLNLAAASAAMAVSAIALAAVGRRGVTLPDAIAQFLVGGGPIALKVDPLVFVAALVAVAAVSALATLYPVAVATSITPLEAMNDR